MITAILQLPRGITSKEADMIDLRPPPPGHCDAKCQLREIFALANMKRAREARAFHVG